MPDENDVREDILYVREERGTTWFLLIAYRPGDSGRAAGYVFRRPVDGTGPAENVLATNDTLRELWCSPLGHPWLTSTTGLVWTTAPVSWRDREATGDLEFEVPEGGLGWRHVELPRQESNGLRPNPMAIWGSSDRDVHVATFGGVLYHWDGEVWTQHDPGLRKPIGALRGRGADDVYAVGYGSTLLHFDGARWRVLDDPDGPATDDILTAVVFLPDGDVLISGKSRGGRVLRGSAERGFTVAGRHGLPLSDMALVDGRLFLAAGKSGAAELTDDGVRILRDDLAPWSVAGGRGRVYFTFTPDEATYAELDLATGEWRERAY
ncbi:hypothetical protein [Streptomyces sp. SID13726]|uniref:hypothetical protein n=1 Tax=Streptomyces sp. SID13726 TaxID=2706058 RepID=UPI0013BE33C5|nr:hypothetical protein [Streptomyces sp. SID13726]NEA97997.1 hypothetical protein [Streptomyces sp. SID13726]